MVCRVVVLVSGTGTLLQSLLESGAEPGAGFQVVAVGSERADAFGLERAERAGVPSFVVPMLADRAEWDRRLTAAVAQCRPDLIVSAGFMKLVGPAFLARFGGRFINSHPALLPSFPGMHGVRDALAAGLPDVRRDEGPVEDAVVLDDPPGGVGVVGAGGLNPRGPGGHVSERLGLLSGLGAVAGVQVLAGHLLHLRGQVDEAATPLLLGEAGTVQGYEVL